MKKFLILITDGSNKKYPIDKDRLIIGRDKACDIVLEDENISRQHVAIVSSFGNFYVENLSSSAQIFKNDAPVEYVQIIPGDVIKLENFEFKFIDGDMSYLDSMPKQSSSEKSEANDEAAQILSESAAPQSDLPAENFEFASAPGAFDSEPKANTPEEAPPANLDINPIGATVPSIDQGSELPVGNSDSENDFSKALSTQISESPTRIQQGSEKVGVLKITKGEQIGREIKLDQGLQWTIGRGNDVEVQVDNPKLSRAHFKIVKIAQGYRIQDLGSSNGTRLNGVGITDAPLQVFDSIKAGPVELQFLIVDPSQRSAANNSTNGAAAGGATQIRDFAEKTTFQPPQPYMANPEANSRQEFSFPQFQNNSNQNSQIGDIRESSFKNLSPKERITIWWQEQPKGRRLMIITVILLVILLAILPKKSSDNPAPQPEVTQEEAPKESDLNAATEAPKTNSPVEDSSDVSPEYSLKSEDEKRRIEELYAKAQQAKARKDWKTAFDASSEILKEVKKYKNAADILDEAQTYLNENQIGALSKGMAGAQGNSENSENKIQNLLQAGERAIQDGRWEDAQEAFTKALTLDPDNEAAKQGFAAAHARDPNLVIKTDDIPSAKEFKNDVSAAERDAITELEKVYQSAKLNIHEGQFRKAIPILEQLETNVNGKLENYNDSSRTPASTRDELIPRTKALMSSIKEAQDRIGSEFRMEYQGLMSDAEIAISNKQFIQAREIYDNIIRKDPEYQEAKEARRKLYSLVLSEARNVFQEGLIYESVSDVANAVDSFEKTLSLLENIDDYNAKRYYEKAESRLKVLKR
ncbi:MAG: FHA domain-containing protein [Proteobacteria bacterium]|nr:FHA domain-containing protein [Pseudomonadota bacterium]